MAVRRTAFLNLGLFAHPECPGGCGGNFVGELAMRAWLAGYHTGVLAVDGAGAGGGGGSGSSGCGAGPADPAGVFSGAEKSEVKRKVTAAVKSGVDGAAALPGDGEYGPVEGQCQPRAGAGASGGEDGEGGGGCRAIDTPAAAMMMQYYKRPKNIKDIVKGLRTIPEDVEVLVNNDSGSEHAIW